MDLQLVEKGDGGDLVKNPKDLGVIFGFENMPYLCLFGGNVKASTPVTRLANEQAFDFWGNNLLMPNNPSIQFNSDTERFIASVSLTSSSRIQIENVIKNDLESMNPFAIIKVNVSIIPQDKLLIGIQITKRDNLDRKEFIYIWDATMSELSYVPTFTVTGSVVSVKIFDYTFDFSFE